MDHLNLNKSRRMAEAWMEDHMRDALAAAPEEERRLLETLYARQRGSLEYLSLIQLDMGEAKPQPDDDVEAPRWLSLLCHPLLDVLLTVLTLACVLLEKQTPAVAASVVMVLRVLLRASHPGLRRRNSITVVPEVHEPYLVENELTRFLQKQTDRIAIDAASIAERQAVTLVRERQDVGEDAVELYCALYEAALDVPDPETLAYPLSILKMSLLERGMEPVAYTGETSALFDVMPGDGQGEMRWPAIRSSENGVILKRGLYLSPRQ